ncbi:Ionotropic glutamate receptor [Trinorchestia longiramus]|nr:Ionotropic glutamate receptor [Trinorchestia longiramus]
MPGLRSLVARRRATLPTPETPQYSALYPVLPANASSNSFQLTSNSFNASVHPAAPASAPHGVSPLGGGPQNGSVAPSYNVYEPGKESGSTVPQSDQPMLYSSTEQQFSQCTVENEEHSKFLTSGESKTLSKDLGKLAGQAIKHESAALSISSSWSGPTNLPDLSNSLQKPNEASVVRQHLQSKQEKCDDIAQSEATNKPNKLKQQRPIPLEEPALHAPLKQQDDQQLLQIKLPMKLLSHCENKFQSEIPAQQRLQVHQHEQLEPAQHSRVQLTPNQNKQQQEQPQLQKQPIGQQEYNQSNSQNFSQKPVLQQFSHQSSHKQLQLDTVHLHQSPKQQKNVYSQSQPPQPQQILSQQYYSAEQQQQSQQLLPVQAGKLNLMQAGQQQQQFLPSSQQDVKMNVLSHELPSNQQQQPLHSGQLLHFQSNQIQNFQTNHCTQSTQLNVQQSNQQYIQTNQQQSIQTQMQQELSSQSLQENRNQQQQVANYQPTQHDTNQHTQQTQQQQVSIYPRTAYSAPPPTAFASNVYPHAALQGGLLYNPTLMAATATPQTPATYLSLNTASAPATLGYNTFGAAGPSLLLVPSQSTGYSSMSGYAQPAQAHSYLLPSQGYSSQPTLQTHFLAQPTQLVTAAAQPQQILIPQQQYQPQTQSPYQSSLYPSTAYAYSSPYQSSSYQSPTHAYISPFQATIPDTSQQTIAAAPAIALQPTISLQAVAQPSTAALGINPSPISSVASSNCLASVLQTVPQPSIASLPSSIVNTSLQGGGTGNNTLLHGSAGNTAVVAATNTLVLQSSNINVACSLPGPVVPVNSNSILQRTRPANPVLAPSVSVSGAAQFSSASAAVVIATQPLITSVASSPQGNFTASASQMKVNSARRRAPKKVNLVANANKKTNTRKGFDFQDKAHATSISINNNMSYNGNMSIAVVSSDLGSTCVPVSSSFSNLSSASLRPSDVPNLQILASASISGCFGEGRKSSFQFSGLEDKIEASEPFDLLLHLDALESLQNSINKTEYSLSNSTPNELPNVRPNQPGPEVGQGSSDIHVQDVLEAKCTSMLHEQVVLPDSSSGDSMELRLEVVKTEPESPAESELKISENEQSEDPCLIIAEQNTDMPIPVIDASYERLNVPVTKYSEASMACVSDKIINVLAAGPSTTSIDESIVPVACHSGISRKNAIIPVTCSKLSTTEPCTSYNRDLSEEEIESPNSRETNAVEGNLACVDDVTTSVPSTFEVSCEDLIRTRGTPKKQETSMPLEVATSGGSDQNESNVKLKLLQLSVDSKACDGGQDNKIALKFEKIGLDSEVQSAQECVIDVNLTTEFTQFQLINQNESSVGSNSAIKKETNCKHLNSSVTDSLETLRLESIARCSTDGKTERKTNINEESPRLTKTSQNLTFMHLSEKIPTCVNSERNLQPNTDSSRPDDSSTCSVTEADEVTGELANASDRCSNLISDQSKSNTHSVTCDSHKCTAHHQGDFPVQITQESDSCSSEHRLHCHCGGDEDLVTHSLLKSSLSAERDSLQGKVDAESEDKLVGYETSSSTGIICPASSVAHLQGKPKRGLEKTRVSDSCIAGVDFVENINTGGISSGVIEEHGIVCKNDLNVDRKEAWNARYISSPGAETPKDTQILEPKFSDSVTSEFESGDSSYDITSQTEDISSEAATCRDKNSGDSIPVADNVQQTCNVSDIITQIPSSEENLSSSSVGNLDFSVNTNEMSNSNESDRVVLPIHSAASNLSENSRRPENGTAHSGAVEDCAVDSSLAKNCVTDSDVAEYCAVSFNEKVARVANSRNLDHLSAGGSKNPAGKSSMSNLASICEIADHSSNFNTEENVDRKVSVAASQFAHPTDETGSKQSVIPGSFSDCNLQSSVALTNTDIDEVTGSFSSPVVVTDASSSSIKNCAPIFPKVSSVAEAPHVSSTASEDYHKICLVTQAHDSSTEPLSSGRTLLELRNKNVTASQTEIVEPEPQNVHRGPKINDGNQTTNMKFKSQKCEDLLSIRHVSDVKNETATIESTKTLRSQSRLRLMRLHSDNTRTKLQSPVRSPRSRLMKKFLDVKKSLNVSRAKRQLITSRAGLLVDKSLQVRQGRSSEGGLYKIHNTSNITDNNTKEERLRDVRISRIRDSTNMEASALPSERIVLKMKLLCPNQKDKSDGKKTQIKTFDVSSASMTASSEWTIDNKAEMITPYPFSHASLSSGKWKTEAVKEEELKVKLKHEKSMFGITKFDYRGGNAPLEQKNDIYFGSRDSELVAKDSLSRTGSGYSQSSGSNSESVSRRSSVDSSSSSRRSSQCSDVSEVSQNTDVSVASCSTNASFSSGSENGVQIVIKKLQDCEGYSCFRTKKKKIKLEDTIPEEEEQEEDRENSNTIETGGKLCLNTIAEPCVPEATVKNCQLSKTVSSKRKQTSSSPKSAQTMVQDTDALCADNTPYLTDGRTSRIGKGFSSTNTDALEDIPLSATQDSIGASSYSVPSRESSDAQEKPKFSLDDDTNNTPSSASLVPSANADQLIQNKFESPMHNNLIARCDVTTADNAARPKRKAALLSQEKCLLALSKLDTRTQKRHHETLVGKTFQTESRACQSWKADRSLSATESKVSSKMKVKSSDEVEETVPLKCFRGRLRLRDSSRPGSALSSNAAVKRDASLSPPRAQSLKKFRESLELGKSPNDSTDEPINIREKDAGMAFSSAEDSAQTDKKNSSSTPHLEMCSNARTLEHKDSHENERVTSSLSEDNPKSKTVSENDSVANSSAAANLDRSHVATEDKHEVLEICESISFEPSLVPSLTFDRELSVQLPKLTASMIVVPLSTQIDVASSPCSERAVTPSPDILTAGHRLESGKTKTPPTNTLSPTGKSFHRSEFKNRRTSCKVSLSNVFYDCKLNHLSCPGCSESLPPQGIMVDVAAHVIHMLCFSGLTVCPTSDHSDPPHGQQCVLHESVEGEHLVRRKGSEANIIHPLLVSMVPKMANLSWRSSLPQLLLYLMLFFAVVCSTLCAAHEKIDLEMYSTLNGVSVTEPVKTFHSSWDIEKTVSTLTTCFFVFVRFVEADSEGAELIRIALPPKHEMVVKLNSNGALMLLLPSKSVMGSLNDFVKPRVWHHLCLEISESPQVFVDRKVLNSSTQHQPVTTSATAAQTLKLSFQGRFTIRVGDPDRRIAMYFTLPSVYPRHLAADELGKMRDCDCTTCHSLALYPWSASSGNMQAARRYPASNRSRISAAKRQCPPQVEAHFVIQRGRFFKDFPSAERRCAAVASELLSPSTHELQDLAFSEQYLGNLTTQDMANLTTQDMDNPTSQYMANPTPQYIANPTTQYKTYLTTQNLPSIGPKQENKLEFFAQEQHHIKIKDGVVSENFVLTGNSAPPDIVCKHSSNSSLLLKSTTSIMELYIDWLPHGAFLCSFSGRCFFFENSRLQDLQTEEEFHRQRTFYCEEKFYRAVQDFPIEFFGPYRRSSLEDNILITVCKKDEFTCSDGSCIYIWQKCDGIQDCINGIDELCCTQSKRQYEVSATSPPSPHTQLALAFKRFRIAKINDGNGIITISLTVLLASVFSGSMFTTGVPCMIITYIGDLTLWFDPRNFTDRIMVTLSCLIVIASLFSQTNATSPSSNSTKMIDHFFLASIIFLFFVCLHHCVVHYFVRLNDNPKCDDKRRGFLQKLFACFGDIPNPVKVKHNVVNVLEMPSVMDSFPAASKSGVIDAARKNVTETCVTTDTVQPKKDASRKPFYKIYDEVLATRASDSRNSLEGKKNSVNTHVKQLPNIKSGLRFPAGLLCTVMSYTRVIGSRLRTCYDPTTEGEGGGGGGGGGGNGLQLPSSCVRVTIMEWPPLSVKVGPYYGGIAVDIIRLVARLNRFCLEFITPPDGMWGMEHPNGSWSGMIGQINRSEADISGTLIFMTEPRIQSVDFSTALYFQEHRIIYKTPGLKPNIAGFLMPFTPTVWVSVLALMTAATIVYGLLLRLYDTNWGFIRPSNAGSTSTLQEPGWRAFHFAVRILFAQSLHWKPNSAKVILFTTGLWMLIAFVVGTMYKSNLKSMIILPKIIIPFETIEELVNQHEYNIIMAGGGSLHQQALESPPQSVLGRLIRRVQINNNYSQVFFLVNNQRYAGIANDIQHEASRHLYFSLHGNCVHTITKTGFVTGMQMSYALQKNSPLKPKFDKVIQRLREAGLLDYIMNRALSNATHCRKKVKQSGVLRPLAFWDFAGMLSVFAGGLFISLLVFIYEIFRDPENVPPPLGDWINKISGSGIWKKRCGREKRQPLPLKDKKFGDEFLLVESKRNAKLF